MASIHLDELWRARGDSADVGDPLTAAAAPHGGVFVATHSLSGLVEQLDSAGRFVRTIGRIGDGPGEYRKPGALLSRGDTLWIWDRNGNVHQFDATGAAIATAHTAVQGATRARRLRGDTLVAARQDHGISGNHHALQLVAPNGTLVRSFGPEGPEGVNLEDLGIDAASDSSLWIAMRTEYALELWGMDGTRIRRLDIHRDWFPPNIKAAQGSPFAVRPTPLLLSVNVDDHGHLITRSRRASSHWRAQPEPAHWPWTTEESMRVIEIVIEVLDATTGKLLAQTVQHDDPVLAFLPGNRAFGTATDSMGRQIPVVWRFTH